MFETVTVFYMYNKFRTQIFKYCAKKLQIILIPPKGPYKYLLIGKDVFEAYDTHTPAYDAKNNLF